MTGDEQLGKSGHLISQTWKVIKANAIDTYVCKSQPPTSLMV
jgi:hypothetical protein